VDIYYQDELATIYHADCREVLPTLAVDAVVSDPPFKLSEEYSTSPDADNLDAVASIIDVSRMLLQATHPGSVTAIFHDNRIMPFALDAFRRGGWQYLRFLTLYRRWGNAHQLNGWMSTSDPVLVFAHPGERPHFYGSWHHDVYVRDTPEQGTSGHRAQKPLAFVGDLVERLTPTDGVVLDPYLGSGTTLIAAKRLGLRAIGIEIEERFCEIAAERLASSESDPIPVSPRLAIGGGLIGDK
jgi:site-specific DNA-methyltransferase (adenine-specific)